MAKENSSRDVYARLFQKLRKVVPDLLTIEESGKSIVPNFMDLNLDVLHKRSNRIIIALSHYYKHPSGDLIADPDMEIAVSLLTQLLNPPSYLFFGIHPSAFPVDGEISHRDAAANRAHEVLKSIKTKRNTFHLSKSADTIAGMRRVFMRNGV